MKLNGRWFPEIVDRHSGNLLVYVFVLICDPKCSGWCGDGGVGVKTNNIISHLMFSSRFMLFPTFLEKK